MTINDPDLDALRTAWDGEPPVTIVSEYRRLERGKRTTALARISVLQQLTRGARPSRSEQEIIAAGLGIGLKRLQALIRAWSNPSIAAITPGTKTVLRRQNPRFGVEITRRIVAKALRRNPQIAEPTVHRRVSALCDRIGHPPPARMTVRSILDQARRALPPPDMDWIMTADGDTPIGDQGRAWAGDVLILTIETLRARIKTATGGFEPGRAVILADAATGHILAAVPADDLAGLSPKAAEGFQALGVPTATVWHPIRRLILGPPTPTGEWEMELRRRADALSVAVTRETSRRTRRWTTSLLWRGTDELAPVQIRQMDALSDLPLYDKQEFEKALSEVRDTHNYRVEEAIDASLGDFERTTDDAMAVTDRLLAALFPSQP